MIYKDGKIVQYSGLSKDTSFLLVYRETNDSIMSWSNFRMYAFKIILLLNYLSFKIINYHLYFIRDKNGNVEFVNKGVIPMQAPIENYFLSSGIDNTYALFTTSTDSDFKKLSVRFIKTDKSSTADPFILYQTTNPHFIIQNILCNTATSSEYSCMLYVNEKVVNNKEQRYFLKISFLATGLVIYFLFFLKKKNTIKNQTYFILFHFLVE